MLAIILTIASYDPCPRPLPVKSVPPAVTDVRISTRTETRDWRSDIADAVKAAVQYQGATERAVVEYDAFGKALQTITGGRGILPGYDPLRSVPDLGNAYQGNTSYGTRTESLSTTADFLGQLDPNLATERYARAVEALGPQQQAALSGLKDTVDQTRGVSATAAAQAARVEALRALPELIRAFMDPQTTIRQERVVVGPERNVNSAGDPRLSFPRLSRYCGACHADGTKLNLDGSVPLSPAMATKASLAVMWGKGLANATTAKKLVKQPMPPKTAEQVPDAELPEVLAEIGRLTK